MEVERYAAKPLHSRLPCVGNNTNQVASRDFGEKLLAHLKSADAEAGKEKRSWRWTELFHSLASDRRKLALKSDFHIRRRIGSFVCSVLDL